MRLPPPEKQHINPSEIRIILPQRRQQALARFFNASTG